MIVKTTPTVDAVEKIAFSGNIIPHTWYKTIRYRSENGKIDKPHAEAMLILSDIVYWYKPQIKRDEYTGELIGKFKRFAADKLQRSYNQISETLGLSYKVVRETVKFLENLGVIDLEFRNIKVEGKGILQNVMFIDLIPEKLLNLTFPANLATDYPIGQSAITQLGNQPLPNWEGHIQEIPTESSSFIHTYKKSEKFEKENSNGALESNFSKTKENKNVVSLKASKSTKAMKDRLHFSNKTNNETNTTQNESQETSQETQKPNFVTENQEFISKAKEGEVPKAPKFENLINLPTDNRTTRLRSAFKKMGLENGYLANSGTPLNDKFITIWEKYIKEIFEKGTDLKDDFHVINFFPNWFSGESATYKPKTQKNQNYNGQYKPTDTVLNNKKPESKRGSFVTPKNENKQTINNAQNTIKPTTNDLNIFGLPNKPKSEATPTNSFINETSEINEMVINNYLVNLAKDKFGETTEGLINGSYWLIELNIFVEKQGKIIIFRIENVSNLHYELIEQMQNDLGKFDYQIR